MTECLSSKIIFMLVAWQRQLDDTVAQLTDLQHQLVHKEHTVGQLTSMLAESGAAASSAAARLEMYTAKTQQVMTLL